ncbi:hypothetical protein AALP_AA5G203300 [Arabis alpina]|uniref:Uncharacterized protein n=1 Tax=Arabis alpina TaxID=50452 RepID=A0A087GYB2_ARAAL|nr:hypothetical protein AALP_AA5G203300 [Arabis alpina]
MSGRDLENSAIDEEQEEEDERSSYYGGATVPFIWETRPGTPKHYLSSDSYSFPPPLTPPPSYYSSSSGVLATPRKQSKVRTKLSKILSMSLFHDLRKSSNSNKKTTNNVYGSSFSWSSTSSSSSFSSSPLHSLKKPVSRGKKSPVLLADYKEDELRSSPTSTLCYSNGGRNGFSSSMGSMKRALFSVPRNGSTGKSLIINDMNKA